MMFLLTFPKDHERDKFENLYHRYKRLALHKARGILKEDLLAEDAVSEAFLRIYKNLHKVNPANEAATASFVCTITRNVALTMLAREQRNEVEILEADIADPLNVESLVLDALSDEAVLQVMEDLPERYRSVFLLHFAYGHSHQQIGSLLNISENNVGVRLHRAKRLLAARLIEGGFVHEPA